MDIREATAEDVAGIRSVAEGSLGASYGHVLGGETIEDAVDRWYDADDLAAELDAEDVVFVVAVEDGTVVGFAQSYVVDRRETVGEIDWLHVDPDHRGRGFGRQLLREVEAELLDRGVGRIEGRVLAANEAGGDFFEEHGYEAAGHRTVNVGGEEFVEELYSKYPDPEGARRVVLEGRTDPEGRQLFVAYDERNRASKAPFYAVYTDADREDRYGWFCGNCEGFDVAMDTMERIECNGCSNRRKPARWDAAYL